MTDEQRQAIEQALEAHLALRQWISAVPDETQLPAMPGMDGDWLNQVESSMREALAAPQEQFQQVGWAISYDGKTPYGFWALEYSQLVDAEVKRVGGTACKIALFAKVEK